jgi:YHS domain-containing protein
MNKKMLIILLAGVSVFGGSMVFAGNAKNSDKKQDSDVKYQTMCPVMGGKINKKLFVDYKGKRIYVCCQGCIKMFKKNPEKYIKKLEKEGVTLEKVKSEDAGKAKTKHSEHKN